MLHKEMVIGAPLSDVWSTWTTSEGLRCVSKESNIELRIAAAYEWFLDGPADDEGIHGSEAGRTATSGTADTSISTGRGVRCSR